MDDSSKGLMASHGPEDALLSCLLPTRLVVTYDRPADPLVRVASVPMLCHGLKLSLGSGHTWRLQKDLTRMRWISQDMCLQLLFGEGPLAKHANDLDALLVQYDQPWLPVFLNLRRFIKESESLVLQQSRVPRHPSSPVLPHADESDQPPHAQVAAAAQLAARGDTISHV